MRPSSRFQYALKALVDLALHRASSPVTVAQIARRQRIPLRYLEQLLNRLRRKGLVVAERGPRGGYRLSRHPSQIPVSEIFQGVELKGLSPPPYQQADPKGTVPDPAESVWRQVESAVQSTLKATTLEQLAAQAQERVPSGFQHRYTFHI